MEPRNGDSHRAPTSWRKAEGNIRRPAVARAGGARAVRDPVHAWKHRDREPGGPAGARRDERGGPHREVYGHTPMMDARGKSDSPVVPVNVPNAAVEPAAEAREGRGLAESNSPDSHDAQTQGWVHASDGLERVRRPQGGTDGSGSPRCCTTCTMSTGCAPPTPR